jgi:putative endonuclease
MVSHEEKEYFVYIMASKKNGTLYTGITSNLVERAWDHKAGEFPGFTKRYEINRLVYFEVHNDVLEAITREKNIKAWKRLWKIKLIEENNPNWSDLYLSL